MARGAAPASSPVADWIGWLKASDLAGQICCHRILPEQAAIHAQNCRPWPATVASLLAGRRISLYSHQALATDHIRAGHPVVVATPTASGKSLVYNLPVLERQLLDQDSTALYLFPLKALAQDQLNGFNELCAPWPAGSRPVIALYDGDTSDHLRRKIRAAPPQVLVTNPEMLHLGILPHHEKWTAFLAGLGHVVVDEAHCYRGVFGAHMAGLFRRLNRIVAHYGARPTYIFCTATVGNPGQLASALMGGQAGGMDPVVIDRSGAPAGKRHFVFVNPAQSPSTAAIAMLKGALARGLRAIVYCQSRRMVELLSLWAGSQAGEYCGRISAYRAGFLPEERRKVEADMASGRLLAVISTSALELGIDIGGLDLCILVGYPGTVMATLQRGGRVGRSGRESAVALVAGEDALDQYFVRHPEDFFSRAPEAAVVNPDNEVILKKHLLCAAAELPLEANDPWLSSPGAAAAARALAAEGELMASADGGRLIAARKRPQRMVDLRGAGQPYVIEDEHGNIIGSLDGFRAWREAHPGAIYLHRGKSYEIIGLDAGRARIRASLRKTSWFTRARGQKSTDILEERGRLSLGRSLICHGRLRITERITGYEKRSASGNRLLGVNPLNAPPQIFESEGIWLVLPESLRQRAEAEFIHFMGSIHALEHAFIGLMPLMVMADRNDFGGISIPLHAQTGLATIFIYDGLPGGAGLSREIFPRGRELLETARKALAACPCPDGCPSCVHSPKCGSGNRPISKSGALWLLDGLLADGGEGEDLALGLKISDAPERLGAMPAPDWRGATANGPCAGNAAAGAIEQTPTGPHAAAYVPRTPPERYLVFDVETRRSAAEVGGWHRAERMGVSVAVCYDSVEDSFFSYGEDDLSGLFERMRRASAVVGFNSIRFDNAVLAPFAPFDLGAMPCVDLLACVRSRLNYRVSLDNLGSATLGEPKSSDGLQALRWWKEGRVDEIRQYCQKDVDITRRLYLHGLEKGYLLFFAKSGQRVRVPVDFALGAVLR